MRVSSKYGELRSLLTHLYLEPCLYPRKEESYIPMHITQRPDAAQLTVSVLADASPQKIPPCYMSATLRAEHINSAIFGTQFRNYYFPIFNV